MPHKSVAHLLIVYYGAGVSSYSSNCLDCASNYAMQALHIVHSLNHCELILHCSVLGGGNELLAATSSILAALPLD